MGGIQKKKIPPELIYELVGALRLDVRWAFVRVSGVFDHFVLKIQSVWIRNWIRNLTVLRRYSAHYLGSSDLSNAEGTEDYSRAMQSAKLLAEQGTAVPWVVLEVSLSGLNIRDLNETVLHFHPIGNIQSVCQDEEDKNWFAFILKEGERRFCHVFCVLKATIAKEIVVTLDETFNLAYNIALQQQ